MMKTKINYNSSKLKITEFGVEKIHNIVFPNQESGSLYVAFEIAQLIRKKQSNNEYCVLGLATGSSPLLVYSELIRMHKEEDLSFKNVITFNLDEYYPIKKWSVNSYHSFMHQHLFDHIDIELVNINIPDGQVDIVDHQEYCNKYDLKIKEAGGLDFQLLGIGRTGHIGFNEPGSLVNSRTRLVLLNDMTRNDAISAFSEIKNVPKKAITMGITTILSAKRIVLLGWGTNKASILKETIEGEINNKIPASYLQKHPDTTFILDEQASQKLTKNKFF